MKKSYSEIKNIFETLPIGFYSGRKITCDLSEEGVASYYEPLADEITVSYPLIQAGLVKVPEDSSYAESAVRAMIYHEVSHAILTPPEPVSEIINIFEDERIETVLKSFYYGVDFKKNIFYLNQYDGTQKPKNAKEAFYHLVRYREGDQALLDEVDDIIYRFSRMTNTNYNTRYYWNYSDSNKEVIDMIKGEQFSESIYAYYYAIYQLYNKIAKNYHEEPRKWTQDVRQNNKGQSPLMDGSENSDEEGQGEVEAKPTEEEMNAAAEKAEKKAVGKQAGIPREEIKEFIAKNLNKYYNISIVNNLRMIFTNFNKKTSFGGASVNSYSGVFDPRNAGREDYRYFVHKVDRASNNHFGHFHLNLFVDDSGSMQDNEDIVNQIIYGLNIIENENANFSYNLITCANQIGIRDKKKGYEARGGTHLRKSIIPIYRQVQKPNSYNYNIVLFDGYAETDRYLTGNTFQIFNNNACTIISDSGNKKSLSRVNNAKIIISKDYTQELIENIYQTLQTAMR